MQATDLTTTLPSPTNSRALYGLALEAFEITNVLATNDCEPCSSGFSRNVATVASGLSSAMAEQPSFTSTTIPIFKPLAINCFTDGAHKTGWKRSSESYAPSIQNSRLFAPIRDC